jgi:uncharacterized protein (DUF1330 family)
MAAYLIADVEIRNLDAYKEYVQQVPPTIEAFGGKFLARGGEHEVLEGEWTPRRLVILEFESLERARAWWSSQEYEAPKRLRQSAAHTNMVLVDGVATAPGEVPPPSV